MHSILQPRGVTKITYLVILEINRKEEQDKAMCVMSMASCMPLDPRGNLMHVACGYG